MTNPNEVPVPLSVLPTLPAGVTVLERGWLPSNNILIQGEAGTALIDSGYCTHASQTLALVDTALRGRGRDVLVNTHLHSDHCGSNAALQAAYPSLRTLPGAARAGLGPVCPELHAHRAGLPAFQM
jgi:glyoxylase-like metal-dependent hydrolase (beta-lactamase superfamily II)